MSKKKKREESMTEISGKCDEKEERSGKYEENKRKREKRKKKRNFNKKCS